MSSTSWPVCFSLASRATSACEDANETALLDHRQAPELVARHQPQRFVEVLLRIDRDEVGGGDLARGHGLRVLALGHDADDDVAVGERPNKALALDDRGQTDVLLLHHLRGVGDRLLGVDRTRVRAHYVSDALAHPEPPFLAFKS